jgi:aspartate carbamoyltransferase catalytic subunit
MGITEARSNTEIPAAFPPSSIHQWQHRHVLDLDDFTREEIELVFEIADAMSEILTREVKKVPTLRGKTIVNLFYEASTRTRASFELAAKNLSADTISLDASRSSISKGESLLDSLRTLKALGADVVVMRHSQSGAPYMAAQHINTSIINAGDGWHAHPSQSLLDLYTIRNHLGNLANLKVVIIGDIMHSRVARSNIWGMSKMGMHLTLCAPPTLMPRDITSFINNSNIPNVNIETRVEPALEGADVVMALRLQFERQQSGLLSTLREYIRLYQLNIKRLNLAKPNALVMHPGPINEGVEIHPHVAQGLQSVIEEQVSNGIAIRMALFYLIAGGKKSDVL